MKLKKTRQVYLFRRLRSFSVLMFTAVISISAQAKQDDLYHKALEAYLVETEKAYSKVLPNRDFRNVVVLRNEYIMPNVPERIGPYQVRTTTEAELASHLRRTRSSPKEVVVAEVRAMKHEGEGLVISIGEYVARLRDGRLVLGLSGGVRTTFFFDCSTRKFLAKESRLFGV